MPSAARRALVVANPKSGTADRLEACLDRLRAGGLELDLLALEETGDAAAEIARRAGVCDIVVVAGGDGTLNLAAPALLRAARPLGILPTGTANDLARTLGLPLVPEEAVEVILGGRPVPIDLGRVNGRPFFNVASIGLAAQVVRFHRGPRKRHWRLFSYPLSLYDGFRQTRAFTAKVARDGEARRVRCIQISVANGRHYGGGLTAAPDARIDDRTLQVFYIKPLSLLRLVFMFFAFRTGWHVRDERVERFKARRVTIETRRPMAIDADGELVGRTPAAFDLLPGALEVLVAEPEKQEAVADGAVAQ